MPLTTSARSSKRYMATPAPQLTYTTRKLMAGSRYGYDYESPTKPVYSSSPTIK
jgi:hypothetical protein